MKRIGLVMIMGVMVLSCQREEGGKPNLYSPLDRATVYHPTFIWESTGDEYELELSDDSTFATIKEVWYGLADTTYTPTDSLDEGLYYWHVRARLGAWGEWSDVSSFFVVGPAWGLISPSDADTVKFPTLVWSSLDEAESYRLFIYQGDTSAGRLVLDTNLTDTSYTITNALDPATYRWGINALIGDEGIPYPEVRRFVTYTLEETFYPVGSSYVWEYEKVDRYWDLHMNYDTGEWEGTDEEYRYSLFVTVQKFIPAEDSLYVKFEGSIPDLGEAVFYRNDSIYCFFYDEWYGYALFPKEGDWIWLPPAFTSVEVEKVTEDTLKMGASGSDSQPPYYWSFSVSVTRCKGVGMAHYLDNSCSGAFGESSEGYEHEANLLNFSKEE